MAGLASLASVKVWAIIAGVFFVAANVLATVIGTEMEQAFYDDLIEQIKDVQKDLKELENANP